MSIFGTLGIGKLGLLAQQRAIQVTSNNIANVNTPGYTRQRPVFVPLAPNSAPLDFPSGAGVDVPRAQRLVDEAVDAQLQRERSAQGFDVEREAGLARVESAFQELGGSGISAALTQLFGAFSELAASPADSTARQQVVQSAVSLVNLIREADQRLAQLQADANARIVQGVREINDIAADIAELNAQIFAKEATGEGVVASALRDARGQLLEQLAERIDFTSFERSDGQIAVFVGGGFLLVDSEQAAQLEARPGAPGGAGFVDVYQNMGGSQNGPITGRISSGTLGAAIDLRDAALPSYRQALDELAFTLADRVNALHYPQPAPALPAGAFGLVDDQQRRFFIDASQPAVPQGAALAQVAGAAGNLAIHPDLLADARHVAAGGASLGAGQGAAPGDGRVAAALGELAVAVAPFYATGDAAGAPSAPAASLGDFFDDLSGRLGAELLSTRRALAQEELIVAQLEERRGALSGVSLDEEVANLVRFERAYQASARVIQTADNLLGMLLEI
jgi:flagellar hook-associated protein 1 FlgK